MEKQEKKDVTEEMTEEAKDQLKADKKALHKRMDGLQGNIANFWGTVTMLTIDVIRHSQKYSNDCSLCGRLVNVLAQEHQEAAVRAVKKAFFEIAGIATVPLDTNPELWKCSISKSQVKHLQNLVDDGKPGGEEIMQKIASEGIRSILKTNKGLPQVKDKGSKNGRVKGMVEVMAEGLESGIHTLREVPQFEQIGNDFEKELQALYMKMRNTLQQYGFAELAIKMTNFEARAIKNEAKANKNTVVDDIHEEAASA